jgi:hypothetical protein
MSPTKRSRAPVHAIAGARTTGRSAQASETCSTPTRRACDRTEPALETGRAYGARRDGVAGPANSPRLEPQAHLASRSSLSSAWRSLIQAAVQRPPLSHRGACARTFAAKTIRLRRSSETRVDPPHRQGFRARCATVLPLERVDTSHRTVLHRLVPPHVRGRPCRRATSITVRRVPRLSPIPFDARQTSTNA